MKVTGDAPATAPETPAAASDAERAPEELPRPESSRPSPDADASPVDLLKASLLQRLDRFMGWDN